MLIPVVINFFIQLMVFPIFNPINEYIKQNFPILCNLSLILIITLSLWSDFNKTPKARREKPAFKERVEKWMAKLDLHFDCSEENALEVCAKEEDREWLRRVRANLQASMGPLDKWNGETWSILQEKSDGGRERGKGASKNGKTKTSELSVCAMASMHGMVDLLA